MEAQQQHQNHSQPLNEENSGGGGNKGSFLCSSRQSSTRWTPTTEQIRILKEIYYNNGIRSPNTEQIQRISARLRQYGKIEGKNVFYWFQNHKARERQKKRLTTTTTTTTPDVPMHRPNAPAPTPNNFSNIAHGHAHGPGHGHGFSSASSGQMGNYGYGFVTMEKSFGDCSISASSGGNNHGWVGVDPYSSAYTNLFDKRRALEEEQESDLQEEEESRNGHQIETLPLFPMHNEDHLHHHPHHHINGFCSFRPSSCFRSVSDDGNGGSLELTLNSYTAAGPNH